MKIDDLVGCSAAELEAMSDSELLEHFKPYFTVTRPEMAPRPVQPSFKPTAITQPKVFSQNLAKMKELGIDLDFLKTAARKKR